MYDEERRGNRHVSVYYMMMTHMIIHNYFRKMHKLEVGFWFLNLSYTEKIWSTIYIIYISNLVSRVPIFFSEIMQFKWVSRILRLQIRWFWTHFGPNYQFPQDFRGITHFKIWAIFGPSGPGPLCAVCWNWKNSLKKLCFGLFTQKYRQSC